MFTEEEFEWTVVVQPDAMKSSAHIRRALIRALLKDFKDVKCTAQHGYHVALTTLEDIGEGRLWDRRGCAAFKVRFRCVVFNLFKDECVLAVVTEVMTTGVMCQCGPVDRLYVPAKYLTEYEFLSAEVDDLLEVTKWRHTRTEETIKKGDVIRVKVHASKWEPEKRTFSAVGSVRSEYGVTNNWPEKKGKEFGKSNFGGDSPHQAGSAGDDGWGDPVANGDDTGGSGWGAPDTNEDDIGASRWG